MPVDLSAFDNLKTSRKSGTRVDLSAFDGFPAKKPTPINPLPSPEPQNKVVLPPVTIGEGISRLRQERSKIGQDLGDNIIKDTLLPSLAPERGASAQPIITPGQKTDVGKITGKVDLSAFDSLGKDFAKQPLVKKAQELGIQAREMFGVPLEQFAGGMTPAAFRQGVPREQYTFTDLGKDTVNFLLLPVEVGYRLSETAKEVAGGKSPGAGQLSDLGIGFKDAKIFPQGTLQSYQDEFREAKRMGASDAGAALKTGMTIFWDSLVAVGTLKGPLLETARAAVRQLPESLLFKIQKSNIPIDEISKSLFGAAPKGVEVSARTKEFINSLSSKERAHLFRVANSYERMGLKAVPIEERKPTKLGEFAKVEGGGGMQDVTRKALPPGRSGTTLKMELIPGAKDAFELAKSIAKEIDFKKALSVDQVKSLAAAGFTPEVFFKQAKEEQALEPLAQEARKYKTAEEWEKSYSKNISNEASPIKDNIVKDFGIRKGDISKAETVKKIGDIEIKKIDIQIQGPDGPWQEKYVFAVNKDGSIVGAADGQKSLTEDSLLRIAVDKQFRNQGIGTEMAKVIGGNIEPKTFQTDVSLAGLKTFLKSQGSSLTDFYNKAVGKAEPKAIEQQGDINNLIDTIEQESASPTVKGGPELVKDIVSQEQFNNMRDLVESLKMTIEEHPAAPLQKYMSTRGEFEGGLREVTGKDTSKFSQRGDDIVSELGFPDAESARRSFENYQDLKEELAKTKKDLNDMAEAIKEAKGQGMELARIQKEIVKALRPKIQLLRKYLQGVERGMARGIKLGKVQGRKELREQLAVRLANKQGNIEEVKRAIMEFAKGLPLNERGKLLATMKNAKTFEDMDEAKEFIKRLGVEAEDRELRGKIEQELADIKPRKDKTGILRGRFDAESQQTLEQIREVIKMDPKIAEAKMQANLEKYGEKMDLMPDSVALENELLQYAGLSELKGMKLNELYDIVLDIKTTGRTKRQVQQENERAKIEDLQQQIGGVLTGGYGLKPGTGITSVESAGDLRNAFNNFLTHVDDAHLGLDFLLDKLSKFDKDSGPLKSVLNKWAEKVHEARNVKNKITRLTLENIQNKIADILGMKVGDKDFRDKMVGYMHTPREVGTFRAGNGEEVKISMTPDILIEKWMQFQDETLIPTFKETMHHTDQMINAIKAAVKPEEVELGKMIMDFYNQYREGKIDDLPLDPIYEKMFGVKLGKVENYSPIRRDADLPSYVQIGEDAIRHASTKASAIKARTANTRPIKEVGAFAMLNRHIMEMSQFKAFSDVIGEARKIFRGDVREAIRQYHGSDALKMIEKMIDDIARDGVSMANRVEWLDKARGNYAVAKIGLNPLTFLKQLSSLPAYMMEMPAGAWFAGVTEFWKNPMANAKFLYENSEMMKARYNLGEIDRDIKLAMGGTDVKNLSGKKSIQDFLTGLVRLGDRVAVVQGGWPVYKYNYDRLIREGKSPAEAQKEAMRLFEQATNRTQQAGAVEHLGDIQRWGSWGNLFTLFKSAGIQQYRYLSAISRALMGAKLPEGTAVPPGVSQRVYRGSKVESAKILFIVWALLPMLIQWISDGFDVRPRRLARAALLGPLAYPVILGDFAQNAGNTLMGLPVFSDSAAATPLGILDDAVEAIKNVSKFSDGITTEETIEAMKSIASAVGSGLGFPVDPALRSISGALDIMSGETQDPRRLVYSEFALGDQGAEKEPKKKATAGWKKGGSTTKKPSWKK